LLPWRKIFLCSIALWLLLAAPAAAQPQVTADAAVLMDAVSGQVLWSKNGAAPLPPASTCKVLTAILALDMAEMTEETVISANAAAVGESSIYLRAGEILTLQDLLYGALLRSGNDACYAIGEQIAGTEPLFVHWLNIKAQTLGAFTANYQNTNGLPAENHVISAADLAAVTRYALADAEFAQIVGTRYADIGSGGSARSLTNTNKLLWRDDAIIGVKTGTTNAAGNCLVAAREDADSRLISVVFHSADRYRDSMALLNWGAENYRSLQLFAAGDTVAAVPHQGAMLRLQAASAAAISCARDEQPRLRWSICLPADPQPGDAAGVAEVLAQDGTPLISVPLLVAGP